MTETRDTNRKSLIVIAVLALATLSSCSDHEPAVTVAEYAAMSKKEQDQVYGNAYNRILAESEKYSPRLQCWLYAHQSESYGDYNRDTYVAYDAFTNTVAYLSATEDTGSMSIDSVMRAIEAHYCDTKAKQYEMIFGNRDE